MGLLTTIATPIEHLLNTLPVYQLVLLAFTAFVTLAITLNVARQLLFKDRNAPPEVFHLIPGLGSTYVHSIPRLLQPNQC
jgi:sterol 14-demethylase